VLVAIDTKIRIAHLRVLAGAPMVSIATLVVAQLVVWFQHIQINRMHVDAVAQL
jgi:hypothetical protein